MVAAGLCAAGCNPLGTSKEEGDDTPPDQVATMPPTSPEAPADASSAAGTSAAATPEPPQFAPPGVFYLLASTSIETDAGVFGLKPGTQVVKQTDGSFIGEGHKLQLTPAQITNDLRVVRKVMAADDQAQNALRMRQQQAAAQRAAAAAATPAAVTPAGKRTTLRPKRHPHTSADGRRAWPCSDPHQRRLHLEAGCKRQLGARPTRPLESREILTKQAS
jgi:hypothetical protein